MIRSANRRLQKSRRETGSVDRAFGCFPKVWLSRYCHASRGKTLEIHEQKVNMEEKLALALHRNCLILLGKLPLRQIVIKSL
jgi:hypothetical protein